MRCCFYICGIIVVALIFIAFFFRRHFLCQYLGSIPLFLLRCGKRYVIMVDVAMGSANNCGHLMLAIIWGRPLCARKVAWSELKFISFWIGTHRLANHNDDDDKNSQQHQNATNGHRHHCTVTHFEWVIVEVAFKLF